MRSTGPRFGADLALSRLRRLLGPGLHRLRDTLVVPVGNGTLPLGTALATAELPAAVLVDRRPPPVAVQAAPVAPLTRAFAAGAADAEPVPPAPTLAEDIAIPHPRRARQILRAVREPGGEFRTVTGARIRDARLDLARRGLLVEPTGAACWSAVRAEPPRGGTVVPLCGAGAKAGLAAGAGAPAPNG